MKRFVNEHDASQNFTLTHSHGTVFDCAEAQCTCCSKQPASRLLLSQRMGEVTVCVTHGVVHCHAGTHTHTHTHNLT